MTAARATRPMVRALWIIPALTCVMAGLAWSDQPAAVQPANPSAPTAGQAPHPRSGEPAPGTTPTTTPKPDTRTSDCERSVAALSGDPKENALLKAPDVQQLARGQAELLTCRAVKEDSDAACKLLGDWNAIKSCRAKRSIFHELRAYPNGRGFMFNDVQFEGCQDAKETASYCEQVRAAARAGDASKCDAVGEFQSNCRALVKLDKSLCTAPKVGRLEGHDKGRSETYADDMRHDCERQVESMAIYAKGVQGVADSGSPLERQLAKAALGQSDACTPFADAAVKACNATASQPEAPSRSESAAPTQKVPPAAPPEKKPPS